MKQKIIILLLAVMLLFLSACGGDDSREKKPGIYDVESYGKVFTVDREKQTITVDGYTCFYKVSSVNNSVNFRVSYPNGSIFNSTYTYNKDGSVVGGGNFSESYDPKRYVAGDILWDVLSLDSKVAGNDIGKGGRVWMGILLILLGTANTVAPRAFWYIGYGWRFKDAEPSDLALSVGRIGGVIGIIVGIMLLFV